MSPFKLTSVVITIAVLFGDFANFVNSDIDCYQCGIFHRDSYTDMDECHIPPWKSLHRFKNDGWVQYTGCEVLVLSNGGILRGPVNTFPLVEYCIQTERGVKHLVCATDGCNDHQIFECTKKDGSRGQLARVKNYTRNNSSISSYVTENNHYDN